MDPTWDTFCGINIGIAERMTDPGMPQRLQIEEMPGIDGARASDFGRRGRMIEVRGYVVAYTYQEIIDYKDLFKTDLLRIMGTYVHYVTDCGEVAVDVYDYCRMVDYRLFGPVGWEPGSDRRSQSFVARFNQDFW